MHTHTQLCVHSLLTYARSAHRVPLCIPQSNAAASKKSLRQTKCKDQARPQHNLSTASHLVDARNRGAKSSGHVTTVPGDDVLPRRGAGQTRARTRQAGSLALLLHEVGHLRLGGLRQLRKARAHPLRVPQELFAALLHTLRGGVAVGSGGWAANGMKITRRCRAIHRTPGGTRACTNYTPPKFFPRIATHIPMYGASLAPSPRQSPGPCGGRSPRSRGSTGRPGCCTSSDCRGGGAGRRVMI